MSEVRKHLIVEASKSIFRVLANTDTLADIGVIAQHQLFDLYPNICQDSTALLQTIKYMTKYN